MFRWVKTVASLGMLVALLVGTGSRAEAQVAKPFKITGEGSGPYGLPLPDQPARPHDIVVGNATHLGRHQGAGTVQTLSATFQPDGHITGAFGSGEPFVFVGANGDELVCDYGKQSVDDDDTLGEFDLTILGVLDGSLVVQALWLADFVPIPEACTGKFAGVTGSWVMIARSEPFILGSDLPVQYGWEGEGRLLFRKGK